jgi:hypothetical protein
VRYLLQSPGVLRAALWFKRRLALAVWVLRGKKTAPPHLAKQQILREYRRRFDVHILVESGTYLGETVNAMLKEFPRIISIELDQTLFELAVKRFRSRTHQVTILQGDSAAVLPRVVEELADPALFWLDGHYSGGITAQGKKVSPVVEELQTILASNLPHVILIDDARLFGTDPGYPSLEEVESLVRGSRPERSIEVAQDVIRVVVATPVPSAA